MIFESTSENQEINKVEVAVAILKKYEVTDNISVEIKLQGILKSLENIFGSLDNLRGKRILDIGCGSIESRLNSEELNRSMPRLLEPWLCRVLFDLGSDPVGIDINNLDNELFEHYQIDVGKPDSLDFLEPQSFDAVNMKWLSGSPEMQERYTTLYGHEILVRVEEKLKELLKPDGLIIEISY